MLATATTSYVPSNVVQMLGADAALRARLVENPAAALRELGVEAQASNFPAEVKLPTQAEINGLEASKASQMEPVWFGFIVD